MIRGSATAREIPICRACGRILEEFEVCECDRPLPRDGLRACCPKFIARSGYRKKSYINCNGRKLRFENRQERDQYYMDNCCSSAGYRECIDRQKAKG